MKRTPLSRKTRLKGGRGPARKTRIRPRNPERIKALRARQFGTDGYREHIMSLRCVVTGAWPTDPAHVLKTRAAGGGPEGLAPLCRTVHTAFDSMGAERFREVYGFEKEAVREWARKHRKEWLTRDIPA